MTDDFEPNDDAESPIRLTGGSTLRSYIELMRLPNVFTAIADVAMGFLFVQPPYGQWFPTPRDCWALAMLMAASSLLYIAGIVLNDVFDVEIDRRERPDRPLPSGRIALSAARRLGWKLLTLGVIFGAGAGVFAGNPRPGVVAALLAGGIVLYDALLKPTPLGPLAMGACRMLNVMLGMSVLDLPLHIEHWLVAGGIGVYVCGITWFARRENERSLRLHLILATLVMIAGIAMLAWFPSWSDRIIVRVQLDPQRWRLLISLLGLLIVWRCFRAVVDPVPDCVRMAVAQGVLSIVMLDVVACYAIRDAYWAGAIALLLLPALFLGRWIRIT
jgi:4-hydroxybenzoate polyprenyltransferase